MSATPNPTATPEVLTLADALALTRVIGFAQRGCRVRWLTDRGTVMEGVARHLVTDPERAGFLGPDDDVRAAWLRVSALTEWFLPVAECMTRVRAGEMSEA